MVTEGSQRPISRLGRTLRQGSKPKRLAVRKVRAEGGKEVVRGEPLTDNDMDVAGSTVTSDVARKDGVLEQ